MEPPEPIINEIKNEKSYIINSDKNHSFTLIIQNFNLSINIFTYYEDIIKHNYVKKLSLDELKQNKYFSICESIDEIYEQLILLLDRNQSFIIEEIHKVYIYIPVEYLKIKEIIFEINEINKKNSEKINDLINYISIINIEIQNLKEENKKLKEENKNLNEKILEFSSFIPYLLEIKSNLEIETINNFNSKIIKNNIQYNKTLKNWINPKIKINSNLLYRMSENGIEYSTFHKLCDNKGPTIVLTELKDGNILGFYNSLNWESSTNLNWKSDLDMFVFSLTQNEKSMKNNENNYGILCNINFGPFSYFLQFNSKNKMNKIYIVPFNNSFLDCEKLLPGKEQGYYDINEVEVYQIIFEE